MRVEQPLRERAAVCVRALALRALALRALLGQRSQRLRARTWLGLG